MFPHFAGAALHHLAAIRWPLRLAVSSTKEGLHAAVLDSAVLQNAVHYAAVVRAGGFVIGRATRLQENGRFLRENGRCFYTEGDLS